MTTKFQIDRPGVYKLRNGKRVYVWPLLISLRLWSSEGDGIANGWRVAEAMGEIANDVIGSLSISE